MIRTLCALVLVLPLSTALPAAAGTATVDLSGMWDLQSTTDAPVQDATGIPPQTCEFEGSAQVTQNGSSLSGSAVLALTEGPVDCPMELSATLTGQVVNDQIEMGLLMGGNLGTAVFGTGFEGVGADTLSGTVFVESGPFSGVNGVWNALRRQSALDIPTLGPLGLVLLVGALLIAATFVLRRRRNVA